MMTRAEDRKSVVNELKQTVIEKHKKLSFSMFITWVVKQLLAVEVAKKSIKAQLLVIKILKEQNRILKLEKKLVHKIDGVGDKYKTPSRLIQALSVLLSDFFEAELCHIYLCDRNDGNKMKLAAISRIGEDKLNKIAEKLKYERNHDHAPFVTNSARNGYGAMVMEIYFETRKEILGTIVLVRDRKPFEKWEVELLKVAESYVDSAIINCRRMHDIVQKDKVIDVRNRVDKIHDDYQNGVITFDKMLLLATRVLIKAVNAREGFLVLFNTNSQELGLAASTKRFSDEMRCEIIGHARNVIKQTDTIATGKLHAGITATLSTPLKFENDVIGVIIAINPVRKKLFNKDDAELEKNICVELDSAIFAGQDRERILGFFAQSVDERIVKILLKSGTDMGFLDGSERDGTVMFADIRDFTNLTNRWEGTAKELFRFLNQVLDKFAEIIMEHDGCLDKYIGDATMAHWGAILDQPSKERQAIQAALAMQKAFREIADSLEWRDRVGNIECGIGITTGPLTVGIVGSKKRFNVTVIGNNVNKAQRLEGKARPKGIMVCEKTFERTRDYFNFEPRSAILKGINNGEPTSYYEVLGPKAA
ncbi:MAG: adenylate/guanylate cyclase domain-containing protein [Patescibacteria group bacterium]|nr:adenylate/guanylate cyclase domain-containing protein [Patescibacteria group bacterium]